MANLSPILDISFLTALARQFRSARDRLTLRTQGNLPGVAELIVALRLYIQRCDRERSREADVSVPLAENPPRIDVLAYYVSLTDAAYFTDQESLADRLNALGLDLPLVKEDFAGKWAPGYYIVRDRRYECLTLVIRGSKELGDLVTNLSADEEPFLGGRGHQGIVKSAYRLHYKLRAKLVRYLEIFRPPNGLVIVGHSLGGAVAAVMTMLIRSGELDRQYQSQNESRFARRTFRSTKCFSFCPPPCLSRDLAERSKYMGITTLVTGFDVVPRLSSASLDRLLVRISRYNWGRDVGDSLGQVVGNVARGFLQERNAQAVSNAVREHGMTGISLAGAAFAHGARTALNNSERRTERSPLWNLALNATVFVGGLVSESVARNNRRSLIQHDTRGPHHRVAARFGMTQNEVERVIQDEMPNDVYLAGRVFHLDRPFSEAVGEEIGDIPPSRLVERDREYFNEIEACVWMVYDHTPEVTLKALEHVQTLARRNR